MKRLQDIGKEVRKQQRILKKALAKCEALARKAGDEKTVAWAIEEQKQLIDNSDVLSTSLSGVSHAFNAELKKRTNSLETKVSRLSKAKDVLTSNNYLLEYKKHDLLKITNKLEEAYEEISSKNKELLNQQAMISEQAERLNAVHEEILAKNEALEMQKEALLDQSDYLHEANQTITQMHREVEKQKNEILTKNEELLNLNNEKNNLISIVAHDLKSPLNQINGLLGLMRLTSTSLSEEALMYIDMMEQSSNRLSTMIAKILDVEAIESQKLNLVMENHDLGELLHSLCQRYGVVATEKSIVICEDLSSDAIAIVDRGYADQVFENLLSNAIKFSPQNKKVYVSVVKKNGRIVAKVKDEGPGLSDDDKKKLFGKYQKLSAKPTGNETSTGLGLSIVKKFVEAMQGEIWCESTAGEGASFFVAFRSF